MCAVLAVAACGGASSSGDDDPGPDGGGSGTPDGGSDPGWTTLIEREWTLGPVIEDYKCVSMRIEEDTYISAMRAVSPVGTHHEVLTASSTPFAATGPYDCDDAVGLEKEMLFAGGIGTQDLVLPAGVAFKLAAGTYINLKLHVANYSDDTVTQTSGIAVKAMPVSEVVHEADMIFAGSYKIMLPPTSQPAVVKSDCVAPVTWNIVSLWPHMHAYGTRFHAYVKRSGGAVEELFDVPYAYTEQKHYPMALTLDTNDALWSECVYVNNTNTTHPPGFMIEYGESATQEMCFTGLIKYPKGGTQNFCVN